MYYSRQSHFSIHLLLRDAVKPIYFLIFRPDNSDPLRLACTFMSCLQHYLDFTRATAVTRVNPREKASRLVLRILTAARDISTRLCTVIASCQRGGHISLRSVPSQLAFLPCPHAWGERVTIPHIGTSVLGSRLKHGLVHSSAGSGKR
jgi:hypothetical protein